LQNLNLPAYKFKFEKKESVLFILDEIRKKFVVCTPEEWVRQNIIKYLINELDYPSGLFIIESVINLKLKTRPDIGIYDKNGNLLLLIECKAPTVKISQDTFNQVSAYNLNFKAKYMIVTNGLQHYCCYLKQDGSYEFLTGIPNYKELLQ